VVVVDKEFRIAEIFGPTIQGEGMNAGLPCHFVRFGGCDYRCSWCDSPHSVLPELVARLPKMSASQIMDQILALPKGPNWVVLSGGNPALFDLSLLVAYLQDGGYGVMAETQGTVHNDWLHAVDELCISPKPPSAGRSTSTTVLRAFLTKQYTRNTYLKVVIFDDNDYGYAKEIHHEFPNQPMFLSVGTPAYLQPTVSEPDHVSFQTWYARDAVGKRFKALAERISRDREMRDVKVLPQLHVIAWGVERGH
jgi:7-carboxy-7-deazaguanine synthase